MKVASFREGTLVNIIKVRLVRHTISSSYIVYVWFKRHILEVCKIILCYKTLQFWQSIEFYFPQLQLCA